jgi:DNA/RNA endonuclease YhcR with UshA esterase domain
MPFLLPGVYQLSAEAGGFKKAVRDNIEIRVGDRLKLDFALELGQLAETVTVVGTIASVFRSDTGTVYLNFGADYPRQTFTAVALAPAPAWTAGLDSLVGRRVAVHGRITSYKGRLEIVLGSADQLAPAAAVDTAP